MRYRRLLPVLIEMASVLTDPDAPLGDCFRWATKNSGDDDTAEVIHGKVQLPSGKRIDHAWVERAGKVFDWQNRDRHPEGIDIATFYKALKAKAVSRYTPVQALIMSVRTMNFGPWTAAEKQQLDDLKARRGKRK